MGKAFHLHIVTPVEKAFDDDAEYLCAPGTEGYLGVLPGHTYLVTSLKEGTLTVRVDGDDREYVIGSGYMEVRPEGVIIITEAAKLP
jgi:F-type H+-transporting ATPase subunit epsilon